MDQEYFLTLGSVFSYLNANVESRCIVEGEEMINAKHLVLIGCTAQTNVSLDILALCLQTSALKSSPHEIKGRFSLVEQNKVQISNFVCSCKAGLSGTCKHIAAVLLKCTRSNISSLEKLSSTDVKCYWTAKKKKVEEEYEAKPILETSCFQPKVVVEQALSPEQQEECFALLASVTPQSSLTMHLKGRSTEASQPGVENPKMSASIQAIVNNMAASDFLKILQLDIDTYSLKPCCRQVAGEILSLDAFEAALSAEQRSDIWHQERQMRITGSRCYSLFTYSKEDWQTKATSYFCPKKFTSKYIQHGLKYEAEALAAYKRANNYDVCEVGLTISKTYPWLAYSPDGIVMFNGAPERLVEIKCPYDGIENDSISFVHSCTYLTISPESGITLKKKHAYYGQVQLGMAILNLKIWDLILYSPKSKSFLNIAVPFDSEFTKHMICNISEKYFQNMLHIICKKRGT